MTRSSSLLPERTSVRALSMGLAVSYLVIGCQLLSGGSDLHTDRGVGGSGGSGSGGSASVGTVGGGGTSSAGGGSCHYQTDETQPDFIVIEAEGWHENIERGDNAWSESSAITSPSGSAYMVTVEGETNIDDQEDVPTQSPELRYRIRLPQAGNYKVYAHAYSPGAGSDSVWIGFNNTISGHFSGSMATIGQWYWEQISSSQSLSSGEHMLHLWMREAGSVIDRIIITTETTFDPVTQQKGLGLQLSECL